MVLVLVLVMVLVLVLVRYGNLPYRYYGIEIDTERRSEACGKNNQGWYKSPVKRMQHVNIQ